jgi:hypothetical protein
MSAYGIIEALHVLQRKNVFPELQQSFVIELCNIIRRFEECAVRTVMVANTNITGTKMNTE